MFDSWKPFDRPRLQFAMSYKTKKTHSSQLCFRLVLKKLHIPIQFMFVYWNCDADAWVYSHYCVSSSLSLLLPLVFHYYILRFVLSKHFLGIRYPYQTRALWYRYISIYNFEPFLFESAQANNNYCIRWSKKEQLNSITAYNIGKATATVRMKWSNKAKNKNTAGKECSLVIILKLHENEKDRWHIYISALPSTPYKLKRDSKRQREKRNRALIIILQRKQL